MLFLIFALIICIPLIVFALSNKETVHLGFWPTDYALEVPLSLSILVAMAIAFVLGALVVWMSVIAQRSRARRAERNVQVLEAQVQMLKAQTQSTAPALPRA